MQRPILEGVDLFGFEIAMISESDGKARNYFPYRGCTVESVRESSLLAPAIEK